MMRKGAAWSRIREIWGASAKRASYHTAGNVAPLVEVRGRSFHVRMACMKWWKDFVHTVGLVNLRGKDRTSEPWF